MWAEIPVETTRTYLQGDDIPRIHSLYDTTVKGFLKDSCSPIYIKDNIYTQNNVKSNYYGRNKNEK